MTGSDAVYVIKRLLLLLYTGEQACNWMISWHPQLNGKPIDCDLKAVLAIIDQLESGAYT